LLWCNILAMGKTKTSWGNVSKWYSKNVGEKGSYYHDQVIFPFIEQVWNLGNDDSLLDLGCGEGVLSRRVKGYGRYHGVDASNKLLTIAREKNNSDNVDFSQYDLSREFSLDTPLFSHAAVILAFQNVENPNMLVQNASRHLIDEGELLLVINHPAYRIPKGSGWGVDHDSGLHYRKIYKYMSKQKIRIDMNPGNKSTKNFTYSYHHSLTDISRMLFMNGFTIKLIEELVSNKVSEGKNSTQENFIRKEIPMFMCILAKKNNEN